MILEEILIFNVFNPSCLLTYFIPQVSFLNWSLSTPLNTSVSIERDEWRKMGERILVLR